MTAMRRVPVGMTREDLVDILTDIRERVRAGDSFEGSIEYLMPGPGDEAPDSIEFMVQGAWRVGNLQGQGGMQMVGEFKEVTE